MLIPMRITPLPILLFFVAAALIPDVASAQTSASSAATPFMPQSGNFGDLMGQPAPALNFTPNDGHSFTLASLHGKPVLLLFWATWCGQCKDSIPQAVSLGKSSNLVTLTVDFDREPALATAFLAQHALQLSNIHDSGEIRRLLHIRLGPYPASVLIDANGRIVYSAWSIYREELANAIAALGPDLADTAKLALKPQAISRQDAALHFSQQDVRDSALQAVEHEAVYLADQRRFSCRYSIQTRTHYESGRSTAVVGHIDEVLATDGHTIESRFTAGDSLPTQGSPPNDSAAETFDIWNNPIVGSILHHSVISNVRTFPGPGTDGKSPTQILSFTFRGDPTYSPPNDWDVIAQAMEGGMEVELTHHVIVVLEGNTLYRVVAGDRFLMDSQFPAVSFRAIPFDGTYLPSIWSKSTFFAVPNNSRAVTLWLTGLTRTFGQRESCKYFEANSTILPAAETQTQPKD